MALTFRDIDNVLRRNPGVNAVAVNRVDYAALLSTSGSETDATVDGDKKKIVYVAKAPNRPTLRILPDNNVRSGDIYIHS